MATVQTKKARGNGPAGQGEKAKAAEALAFARSIIGPATTQVEAHNAIFGVDGKTGQLFATSAERAAFLKTPEHAEIRRLLDALPGDLPAADASGKFNLRLPKSLHAALVAEAEGEGVSLNQLCLAKLAVQLRDAV